MPSPVVSGLTVRFEKSISRRAKAFVLESFILGRISSIKGWPSSRSMQRRVSPVLVRPLEPKWRARPKPSHRAAWPCERTVGWRPSNLTPIFTTTRYGPSHTFRTRHEPYDQPVVAVLQHRTARPGMVGMLAAADSLDPLGRSHDRLWGDLEEDTVSAP